MARKFRPVKFVASISIMLIGLVVILNYVSEDNSFGVLLDIPPNAVIEFVGSQGETVEVPVSDFDVRQIACWVQSEMEVINKDGVSRGVEKSSFLKVNPTIPLRISDAQGSGFGDATLTGDQGGFIITPTIMCSVDFTTNLTPEDTFSQEFDILGIPQQAQFQGGLIVQPSELVIRVYGNDETDCELFSCNSKSIYHDIYNAKLDIPRQEINSNDKVSLASFKVEEEDLESGYKVNGQYLSDLLFTLDGVIKISFQADPTNEFLIPTNTERTFRDGLVTAYGTNNWANINNDLLTHRQILVQKNIEIPFTDCPIGTHLEPSTGTAPDDCVPDAKPTEEICGVNEYENPIGSGICIPVETQPTGCTPPLVPSGNICVNPNTNGGTGTGGGTGIVIVDEWIACAVSGNPTCLTSPTFLPLYLILFGFIILIVAIAQGARRSSTDIYGVPTNY